MRILRFCFFVGILLAPRLAFADDHRMDLYGGFSGGNGASKLFGFHQAIGIVFSGENPKIHRLSAVADFSVQFANETSSVTQVLFMVGGRYAFSRPADKNKISAHFLGGTEYYNQAGGAANAGVYAFGAGYEYLPTPKGTRQIDGLGYRAQVDHIIRPGSAVNFWRVSGGIVYRFGQH